MQPAEHGVNRRSNSKYQAPNNKQISNSNVQNQKPVLDIGPFNIEFCLIFVIWNLEFKSRPFVGTKMQIVLIAM